MFTPEKWKHLIGVRIASNDSPIVFMHLLQGAVPTEILALFNCIGTSCSIARKANDDFRQKHPNAGR